MKSSSRKNSSSISELRITCTSRRRRHSIRDQFTSWHCQDGASEVLHLEVTCTEHSEIMCTHIWILSSSSFYTALRKHEIHGNMQITQQKVDRRNCAICCGDNFLEIIVLCLSLTTLSSKGIWSESHCKICDWLFNIWLTRSIMFLYTLTNLLLNVKSVPMMKLLLNEKKCCYHRTFFIEHQASFWGFPALFLIQQPI